MAPKHLAFDGAIKGKTDGVKTLGYWPSPAEASSPQDRGRQND